jgi:uncharacterized OB-fold protein
MAEETKAKAPRKKPEYIHVKFARPRLYSWSTGKHVGRLYAEAKENKKIVFNRCPKCHQTAMMPTVVCPKCKIDMGEDWVELPQTGEVYQYTYLVLPLWDPHYGEKYANPYPSAIILLDDGTFFRHRLEETDKEKLKDGMRVQAVWEEDYDKRGQGMGDILYWRTIEE